MTTNWGVLHILRIANNEFECWSWLAKNRDDMDANQKTDTARSDMDVNPKIYTAGSDSGVTIDLEAKIVWNEISEPIFPFRFFYI